MIAKQSWLTASEEAWTYERPLGSLGFPLVGVDRRSR